MQYNKELSIYIENILNKTNGIYADLSHLDITKFKLNNTNKSLIVSCYYFNKVLNFTPQQLDYIIKHTDLSFIYDSHNMKQNALMFFLSNNNSYDLSISSSHLTYLIENSDLTHTDLFGCNALKYAIENDKKEHLHITMNQWTHLTNNCLLDNDCNGANKNLLQSLINCTIPENMPEQCIKDIVNANLYKKDNHVFLFYKPKNLQKIFKYIDDKKYVESKIPKTYESLLQKFFLEDKIQKTRLSTTVVKI